MSELPPPYPFEKVRSSSGKDHELTRDNATLYTYLGKQAIYDHIYVETEDKSVYLWRFSPMTGREVSLYNHIKPKVLENDCQAFMNIREISDGDLEIYVRHAMVDLKDIPPKFDEEE